MTAVPPYVPPSQPVKGRVALWLGGLFLLAGIVIAVVGGWYGVDQASSIVDDYQRVPVAGGGSVELEAGTYRLYHEAPGIDERYRSLPAGLRIVGPDGRFVSLRSDADDETYSISGRDGRRIGRFQAPVDGTYEIRAGGTAGTEGSLAVGRRSSLDGFGILALAVIGGGLLAALGVVLIIVGAVRRSRSRRPPVGPWGPYPGGAPPGVPYGGWGAPSGPGGQGWTSPPPAGPPGWAPPPGPGPGAAPPPPERWP